MPRWLCLVKLLNKKFLSFPDCQWVKHGDVRWELNFYSILLMIHYLIFSRFSILGLLLFSGLSDGHHSKAWLDWCLFLLGPHGLLLLSPRDGEQGVPGDRRGSRLVRPQPGLQVRILQRQPLSLVVIPEILSSHWSTDEYWIMTQGIE